jgi:hypothetical protein
MAIYKRKKDSAQQATDTLPFELTPAMREELTSLERQLRESKDQAARARWAEILYPAALATARKLLRGKDEDEMQSLATVGVANALVIADRLISGKSDKLDDPDHYAWSSMRRAMIHECNRNVRSRFTGRAERVELYADDLPEFCHTNIDAEERFEEIIATCQTELERDVVTALRENHPHTVAKLLKQSILTILATRERVFANWKKRLTAEGEFLSILNKKPARINVSTRQRRPTRPWKADSGRAQSGVRKPTVSTREVKIRATCVCV